MILKAAFAVGIGASEIAGATKVLIGAAKGTLGFDDIDVILRQFIDKARWHSALIEPAHAPVLGKRNAHLMLAAGDADIGQPPFFFQPLQAAFVQRALVREQALLPAGQKHRAEFQTLGGVQGHQRDAIAVVARGGIHHKRHVLQKTGQRFKLMHEAHKLFQILQPRLRLRAFVGLPHGGIAALIQDQFGKLGVADAIDLTAPVLELVEQIAEPFAGLAAEFFCLDDLARGDGQRHAARAGILHDALDRCLA